VGPITQSVSRVAAIVGSKLYRTVYQPIVDLHAQQLFAYEALVRVEEFSPPDLFSGALRGGLVGRLGKALRTDAVAHCENHPLFLNVHPAELNEQFLVQPDDAIFQHPSDVYLELTESVPLSHFDRCLAILEEIRGRGIYLVIDDLGAGYSNLKYIVDLHPTMVKLDRELIAGMTPGTRNFTLVKHIVSMCRDLGASVVCEGIETPAELDAVLESGARFGQGYLLGRPGFPLPPLTWPSSFAPEPGTPPPPPGVPVPIGALPRGR
jgi:EAL domain-containing protein (putative c-di-GMP-specific phosphodiesterase class I)